VTTAASTLPHWDMTVIYPSLESPEFTADFDSYLKRVEEVIDLFKRLGIEKRNGMVVNDDTISAVEQALTAFAELVERGQQLGAYISSFVATDSRNTAAQARISELSQRSVVLSQLQTRFTAWIGGLDVEEIIRHSTFAADHAFPLRKSKIEAEHLMSSAEEDLAAELSPSSGTAWSMLHGNVTSQLMVQVDTTAGIADMPMSAVRNLAMNADRDTRRRGYEAEITAWERSAVPLAAALNSIKAQANVLDRRRHWASPLDAQLSNNNISRNALDSMMAAAHDSFPDFRRYLTAKARAMNIEKLAWYDIFAPVGASERQWEYADATRFIVDQFGTYSAKLSDFAARAFRENWIDAEPRAGKRDGAFCMRVRRDESRIMANFVNSYDGMSTLAHELGHGYHNLCLSVRPTLLRNSPMTLAETASIFCQTLIKEAVLQNADRDEQISILEASLQDQTQVVVDITSRFLFESRVFERRQQRELSVQELNEVMLQAQKDTYGDALDESVLHPYMWAVKGHYYSVGRGFYNYPYMFGLLFGLGLFARYQSDPDAFRASYDDLLSSTGMADAATLASRFGFDIETRAFWDNSLSIVRTDVDRFEALVNEVATA
jgi:oligoendopeptidase F